MNLFLFKTENPYQNTRVFLFALMVLCIPVFMIFKVLPVPVFTSVFLGLSVLWVSTYHFEGVFEIEDLPLLVLITATFTFGRAFSVIPLVKAGNIPIPVTEIILAVSLGLMLIHWRYALKDWTDPLPTDLRIGLPVFLIIGTLYLMFGFFSHGALAFRDITFCHYLLFIFVTMRVINRPKKVSSLIRMFVPFAVVLLAVGFIMDFITKSGQIAFNRFLFDSREFNWALYYGLTAIFALAFFSLKNEKWRKWGLGIFIYLGLLLMLMTEVRAAWVGIIPALILVTILMKKEVKILLLIIPVLAVSLFLVDYFFKRQTVNMIKSEVEGFTPGERDTRAKKNVVFRLLIWEQTWKLIQEKPVLGWGFGSFPQYYIYKNPLPSPKGIGPGSSITPAHNHVLAITYKMGFLGLALFLFINLRVFLLGALYYRKCRSPLHQRFLGASLAALVFWHGNALFFDVLESPPTGIFLWVILGAIISIVHLDKKIIHHEEH